MKKMFLIMVAAVVVALLLVTLFGNVLTTSQTPRVFASKLAGIVGPGNSGIQIQNLHQTEQAAIVADFYPQGGGGPITLNKVAPAGGSANIYLPTESAVGTGAYGVIISSDKPIAAIARTEWADVGGAGTYSSVDPATSVLLPLATKDFANQTSQFSVQNTDTTGSASITVKVFARGQSTAVVEFTDSVLPGTSKTYDLSDTGRFPGLPDCNCFGVPTGFLGSITVDADKPIVVQSFVDFGGGSKAVYAFSGIDKDKAADTLYAPLVRRDFYGDTGISIVNPNPTSVDVTITYRADPLSPNGGEFTQSLTIEANSAEIAYQGPGGFDLPDGPGRNDGWFGSATLEATGPIAAIVNDALNFTETSAAYNVPSAEDGAPTVSLPLVRRRHVSAQQLTTGVQCMNIGASDADMTISFTGWDGTSVGTETKTAIPQYGSANFYQDSATTPVPSSGRPEGGWFGSATVTSTQPIVCIVNDASLTGVYDAAIYNGIKVPE